MELVAVSAGGISIYAYGMVMLVAVSLGLLVALGNVRMHGWEPWRVEDMLLWGLPLAFLGGRMAYAAQHWLEFSASPISLFCFWQGGLSLYGSVLAFLFVVLAYSEIHGFDAWRWLDFFMPAIALVACVHGLGLYSLQFAGVLTLPVWEGFHGEFLGEWIGAVCRPLGLRDEEYFSLPAMVHACMQMLIFLGLEFAGIVQRQRRVPWASGCIFLLGACMMAIARLGCGFFSPALGVLDEAAAFDRIFSAGVAVLAGLLFRYRLLRKEAIG